MASISESNTVKTFLLQCGLLFLILGMAEQLWAKSKVQYSYKRGVAISNWISQHDDTRYADPTKFSRADAKWIAKQGFDHIRIPIDARVLINYNGELIREMIAPFDNALAWAKEYKLGVILDMHILPGSSEFGSGKVNPIWEDGELQEFTEKLWQQFARRYARTKDILRFELFNEISAPEASDIAALNKRLVKIIRKTDNQRVLYVSTNRWGTVLETDDIHIFKNDPKIRYSFHYFRPTLFTLQQVSWSEAGKYYRKAVKFPSELPNLEDHFPYGHRLLEEGAVSLKAEAIEKDFAAIAAWAKKEGVIASINEFGVIKHADNKSTYNWVRTVKNAAQKHDIGITIWDYQSDFGVRRNGKATPALKGLFSR